MAILPSKTPMKKYSLLLITMLSASLFFAQSVQAQKAPHLNHIAHYVKDLAVSTAFYQKVIGLDTIPEPFHDGRHTWFSVAEHSHLHIISGAKEITQHDKNSHLCFSVPSVEKFIEVLRKNSIKFEAWNGQANTFTTRVDGVKQVYFQDPDNYWVEINDDKY
jgi:lactoylglutathione lyase